MSKNWTTDSKNGVKSFFEEHSYVHNSEFSQDIYLSEKDFFLNQYLVRNIYLDTRKFPFVKVFSSISYLELVEKSCQCMISCLLDYG